MLDPLVAMMAGAPDYADHLIAFGQQHLRQIGPVLAGDPGDERLRQAESPCEVVSSACPRYVWWLVASNMISRWSLWHGSAPCAPKGRSPATTSATPTTVPSGAGIPIYRRCACWWTARLNGSGYA